jgi:type III pantothenate kinase
MTDTGLELIAISVGNTRTRLGLFRGKQLEHSDALPNTDPAAIVAAALALPLTDPAAPVAIASVNEGLAAGLARELGETVRGRGGDVFRFGRDIAIPISNTLDDDSTVGQDRLLNAIGAFSRAEQACIVVDAGTAVTVDFVDGHGVFQGGAIAPGVTMMLRALHAHTAALPQVAFEPAGDAMPLGKDTRGAMLLGVHSAVRGMVRVLIDRYAHFYGAYPQIIATGGDARTLFEGDDLVEHIVPELTLLGIETACRIQLGEMEEDDGPGSA